MLFSVLVSTKFLKVTIGNSKLEIPKIELIKQNSPRPYPTVRPMDKRARENHAKHGRVFETSMLLFDTKHCDCCGITVPIHDDPQMQKLASSKDHTV